MKWRENGIEIEGGKRLGQSSRIKYRERERKSPETATAGCLFHSHSYAHRHRLRQKELAVGSLTKKGGKFFLYLLFYS